MYRTIAFFWCLLDTSSEALIPVVESALVSMGTEARLELKLDLGIDDEELEVGTEIGLEEE